MQFVEILSKVSNLSYAPGIERAFCFSCYVVPPKTDIVEGQVTLQRDEYKYHPDYKNHSSARFRDLSTKFSENVS